MARGCRQGHEQCDQDTCRGSLPFGCGQLHEESQGAVRACGRDVIAVFHGRHSCCSLKTKGLAQWTRGLLLNAVFTGVKFDQLHIVDEVFTRWPKGIQKHAHILDGRSVFGGPERFLAPRIGFPFLRSVHLQLPFPYILVDKCFAVPFIGGGCASHFFEILLFQS